MLKKKGFCARIVASTENGADEMKNKSKVLVILVILAALVLSTGASGASGASATDSSFPDMDSHWAKGNVSALAEKGIISGMDDGLFHPNELVTTAEFVKMVIQGSVGTFPPTGAHWASGYLGEALRLGIIDEYDVNGRDEPLIRRFAARICHNTLTNILEEDDEPNISAAENLEDLHSCTTCVWGVAQCYMKGIMIGRPDGLFDGESSITRAEAATVIMRLIEPSARLPQKAELPNEQNDWLISADEALQILSELPGALLVDVRDREEHDGGYIPGSICVPLTDIDADLSQTAIPDDRDSVIILYCQKGSRSQKAYELLTEAGYINVYSIGGVEDWPYELECLGCQ